MKFGKQLQLGIYEPWTEYYIAYARLKRLMERKRFQADKTKTSGRMTRDDSFASESGHGEPTENTRLVQKNSTFYDRTGSKVIEDAYADEFFPILENELKRISSFYVGKLAELKLGLELVLIKRDNWLQSHHTGNKPSDLSHIRDMYLECKALVSYQKLNVTGVYKIVKKYDKTMRENHLEEWKDRLTHEPFAMSNEAELLLKQIEELVSRGILVEWERYATENIGKGQDTILPAVHLPSLAICVIAFLVCYLIPWQFGNGDAAAARCLALLVFVVLMWVTKAIPYFATALMIPVLVTILGVMKDSSGNILNAKMSSQLVLSSMTNHTTFLLLGGYTISSAFARCELEQYVASWLQVRLGHSPRLFILAVMFLGLFLSMWISNHTAPILCTSILTPIISDLPQKCRFIKGLLLGLAFACNFGGMTTPISSLQNALAVGQLQQIGIPISFAHWLAVSVPFCTLGVLLSWLFIIVVVRPDDVDLIPTVVYKHHGTAEISTKRNATVILLCFIIVIFLATSQFWEEFVGDIGIISLCFLTIMFGSGILTEVDFNSLSWHTLFLLGGGSVLGKAISSSKLLNYIADAIIARLPFDNPWLSLVIILMFCLSIGTFVSHTVASLILMPIITALGVQLGIPKTFVIGCAFAISAGMGLPFSSFPNVNSMLIVDDFQKPYLSTWDFAISGGTLSVITVFLIASIGYYLIEVIM